MEHDTKATFGETSNSSLSSKKLYKSFAELCWDILFDIIKSFQIYNHATETFFIQVIGVHLKMLRSRVNKIFGCVR